MDIILLISDNEDIYDFINISKDVFANYKVMQYNSNEIKTIAVEGVQAVIVNFDRERLKNKNFKILFDIKCRIRAPILSVMARGSTRDKLDALTFGTEDYLDWPVEKHDLVYKLENLCRVNRYYSNFN